MNKLLSVSTKKLVNIQASFIMYKHRPGHFAHNDRDNILPYYGCVDPDVIKTKANITLTSFPWLEKTTSTNSLLKNDSTKSNHCEKFLYIEVSNYMEHIMIVCTIPGWMVTAGSWSSPAHQVWLSYCGSWPSCPGIHHSKVQSMIIRIRLYHCYHLVPGLSLVKVWPYNKTYIDSKAWVNMTKAYKHSLIYFPWYGKWSRPKALKMLPNRVSSIAVLARA